VRETIESVVIAFVLAFLFRTFEAEAFVIPTGSMAPTLMGRHKDVECPKCHYWYQVSASDEVDQQSGREKSEDHRIESATCPMCRFTMNMGGDNPQHKSYPSYGGDRILVSKFSYQFHEPERWEVIVFKYPGEATTNYIKRLVGLPGETVRITHGDIFIKRGDVFEIVRKTTPQKLLAMLQPVYDNNYVTPQLVQMGWPLRWQSLQPDAWAASEDGRSYQTDGSMDGLAWLRYRHVIPSYEQWQYLKDGQLPPGEPARPQLISDFNGYNTGRERGAPLPYPDTDSQGRHWVGDLAVEATLEVLSGQGTVVLELVEGGRRFQCRLDLATGSAGLEIAGLEGFRPAGQTPIRGPGTYAVRFSNIDDQLLLWVNDRPVAFNAPTAYEPLQNHRPTEDDLAPLGIASQGAAIRVRDLRVLRDIYYIAEQYRGLSMTGEITDFRDVAPPSRLLSDSGDWRAFDQARYVEFVLKDDQFFVLGDNSARSKDSRLWESEHYVHRDLLIGKALLIYWPHSWHRIPGTPIPFPFFPNFARMGFVR